jgi:hypothetical protein
MNFKKFKKYVGMYWLIKEKIWILWIY